MQYDHNGLVEAMQLYFDGLYHSDTERLEKVFHPEARYLCAVEEPMTNLGMTEYFEIVRNRDAPAARLETRKDRITAIQFAGPDTALVTARCAIAERHFTDLLSFVRVENQWRIIAKLFHYDIIPEGRT